jgi:serine protease Do
MKFKQMLRAACLGLLMAATPIYAAPLSNLPDFTQIVEKEGKAVVNISTTSTVRYAIGQLDDPFFDLFRQFGFQVPQLREGQPEQREQSLGSGFIIAEDGYIITNAHVVARADKIMVRLADKRTFKAKVIGSDTRADIALLKIEAKGLPRVEIGSSKATKVGEWVLAIGSPFGFESTVTSGILSAKGRNLHNENHVPFLQTDAAVNPGNSGGPLFNLNGQVIGVNSQIYSQSGGYMGISFAIPIDEAMHVVQQLKTKGKVTYGRLGVAVQGMSEDLGKSFGLARAEGALVASVDPDGPAAKAGIKAGDIILRVNGTPILASDDLPRLITVMKPGTIATVQLWRNKSLHTVNVTLGELKQDENSLAGHQYPLEQKDTSAKFGLQLAEVPQQQLNRLGVRYGLYVQAVRGAALEAGLRRGDIIVGIGTENITSFNDLKRKLGRAKAGEVIPLRIIRQGSSLFLSMSVPD